MADPVLTMLRKRFRSGHQRLIQSVDGLTDEQLAWQPSPYGHSIAFEVWHVARSNDWFASIIAGLSGDLQKKLSPGRQIWEAEGLTAKWGLNPSTLGPGEVGFGMDDAAAARLRLPGKAVVLDYTRRALAASERAVDAVDDQQMVALKINLPLGERPVAFYLLEWIGHDEWGLGQVACLRRAQNLSRVTA